MNVKRMKMVICIILSALMILSITACGTKSTSGSSAGSASGSSSSANSKNDSKSHKVAMILPGSITDKSWNYTSYDGLKKIEADGAEISYQEKVDTSQVEDSIRTYASSGYDLIYIGSNIFEDQTVSVAADFPDVTFIIISGNTNTGNVHSFHMSDAEKGFMMGIVAGLVTKSNSVGLVSSVKITPLLNAEAGFKYGVSYVNPDAQVDSVITGNSSDTAAAKETAKAMIDNGADVIAANANAASSGPIQAAEENSVSCIAPGPGYEDVAPSTLLTSVIMDNGIPVYSMYQKYLEGNLPSDIYEYGAKEGVVSMGEWQNNAKITDEIKEKVQQVYDDLKNGKIDVPTAS